jgi:hypothetical protein
MHEMATAGVPNGTIMAVHLQKCSHLSNKLVTGEIEKTKNLGFIS